jgi:hypothetical protein
VSVAAISAPPSRVCTSAIQPASLVRSLTWTAVRVCNLHDSYTRVHNGAHDRTTLSVLEGIIYFQEYRDLDFVAGIVFFTALLVIFFGVYLLSSGGDGSGSNKAYAPVPTDADGGEENWDPSDPTTPRSAGHALSHAIDL